MELLVRTGTRSWRLSIDASAGRGRNEEDPVTHLLVGQITTAHGLGGEVSVKVHSEDISRFSAGSTLLAGQDPSAARPLTVEAGRPHSRRSLVKFAGIDDRTAAEGLRGMLLFVPVGEKSPLEPGAYWEHELAGSTVMDRSGHELGLMSGVEERFEQDVWCVETLSGTVMLPAARNIILSVDLEAKVIVVDPPPGLFQATGEDSEIAGPAGEGGAGK